MSTAAQRISQGSKEPEQKSKNPLGKNPANKNPGAVFRAAQRALARAADDGTLDPQTLARVQRAFPAYAFQRARHGERLSTPKLLAFLRENKADILTILRDNRPVRIPPPERRRALTYAQARETLKRRRKTPEKADKTPRERALELQSGWHKLWSQYPVTDEAIDLCLAGDAVGVDRLLAAPPDDPEGKRSTRLRLVYTLLAQIGKQKDLVRHLLEDKRDLEETDEWVKYFGSINLSEAYEADDDETFCLLLDSGADINYDQSALLNQAVTHNKPDRARFLLAHGADINSRHAQNLRFAAENGHAEMVDLLLEHDANIHTDSQILLFALAHGGFAIADRLIEAGADPLGVTSSSLFSLASSESLAGIGYLLGKGVEDKLGALSDAYKERAARAWRQVEEHRERHGAYPPHALDGERFDAAIYQGDFFKAVKSLLRDEIVRDLKQPVSETYLNRSAYRIATIFGDEDHLARYLVRWSKVDDAGPLATLATHIPSCPLEKLSAENLLSWRQAVMRGGRPALKLLKHADLLPSPQPTTAATMAALADLRYPRAADNRALARFCLKHEVDPRFFDRMLDLVARVPEVKHLPDLTIPGERFDLPGTVLRLLPKDDWRGLVAGHLVDNCQSVGKQGRSCAEHGYTSPHGGFYIIETVADKEMIGISWAWRGQDDELVLDSLERLGDRVTTAQWFKAVDLMAEHVAERNEAGISRLLVGRNIDPKMNPENLPKIASPAIPRDYKGYRESHIQFVAALFASDSPLADLDAMLAPGERARVKVKRVGDPSQLALA